MNSNVDPEELGRIAVVIGQRGYVPATQAAKLLGCHVQTLRTYFDKGYVRFIMVGQRKCVTFDEIKRYKEEGNWDPSRAPIDPME